jgi:hypothetical protein
MSLLGGTTTADRNDAAIFFSFKCNLLNHSSQLAGF